MRFHKLDVSPATNLVRFAATGTLGEPPPTPQPITASAANPLAKVSPVVLAAIPSDVQALLAEFPAILSSEDEPPAPTHGVEHHIETTGRPIFSKAPRLDSEKLALAKAEFQQLEKLGIVRCSNSAWSSPLHMVQKPSEPKSPTACR